LAYNWLKSIKIEGKNLKRSTAVTLKERKYIEKQKENRAGGP
jgi:hypothetical protein